MVSNHFEDPFLKILPKLDLHGETEDLAGYIIQEFIKENRLTGNLKVQIIHGRHGGVLKKKTHEVLSKLDGVKKFYIYESNDGITIAELYSMNKKS